MATPASRFSPGSATPSFEALDDAQCWDLVASCAVGRLAVDVAGEPDIFPINHLVDPITGRSPSEAPVNTVLFRTGAGTKLAAAVLGRRVAYEVDGYDPATRSVWSVVVKGDAQAIESMFDMYRAQDLPLFPWVVSAPPDYVRIHPRVVTGRRYRVFDDVIVDGSLGWSTLAPTTDVAVAPTPGQPYHPGAPRLHPD